MDVTNILRRSNDEYEECEANDAKVRQIKVDEKNTEQVQSELK